MAILVKNLKKYYRSVKAIKGISFHVKKGEIFGFLGPNGAGKTTTIKMLCTLIKPTSGTALINGYDILKEEKQIRSEIGVVFQEYSLDSKLSAIENLELHARLYNLPTRTIKEKAMALLRLVGLEDRRDDIVKNFSGGMKRRLEIARGLMHVPKILFLDEPTIGLDPQTRKHIWDYIISLKKERGVTIILTTHYMEEAEELCDRVAIIDNGQIIALDTPAHLKKLLGGDTVLIKTDNPELTSKLLKNAKRVDSLIYVTMKDADKKISRIITSLEDGGVHVLSIRMQSPSLNDVFLKLTGKEMRDGGALCNDWRHEF